MWVKTLRIACETKKLDATKEQAHLLIDTGSSGFESQN